MMPSKANLKTDGEEAVVARATDNYLRFLSIANSILGAFLGMLITFPASMAFELPHLLVVPLGFALGAMVGYRRRHSRAFLYFSLIGTAILSALIAGAFVDPVVGGGVGP